MAFRMDQIFINQCYQTVSGEIRHVTDITPSGEVSFTSIDPDSEAEPVRGKQTPLKTFADEAERDVPCP